jgi:hypothetical protein
VIAAALSEAAHASLEIDCARRSANTPSAPIHQPGQSEALNRPMRWDKLP